MQKPAETQFAIHELLQNRWSPSVFSSQPVEREKLLSLFEAARWSPSAGNSQPWSFIVVTQEDAHHQQLVEAMTGRNPKWANHAPVLVLTLARLNPERPEANSFAFYDLGQSAAHLTIQASAIGLHVHQMGGFDRVKARELFDIPEGYALMTIIAIGYPGETNDLSGDLLERELSPRSRKPITDVVFEERWNQPVSLVEPTFALGD